jgi:glycosyltransferase involved in cell wall biosynthesis
MKNPGPRIDIAIPTIGRASLKESVRSVFRQSYTNWRLWISDNSNSSSVQSYCNSLGDFRVKYIGHPISLGPVGNFNYCLGLCSDEFLVILHDDDDLERTYLEKMVEGFNLYNRASWAFCNSSLVDNNTKVKRLLNKGIGNTYFEAGPAFARLLLSGHIKVVMPSVMFTQQICKSHQFDPDVVAMCDYKMWIDLAFRFPAFYLSEPIFNYSIGSTNGSIECAHEGVFFRDLLSIIAWLERGPLASSKIFLAIFKTRSIFYHCMVMIWMQYRHPRSSSARMIESLSVVRGPLTAVTSFILGKPLLVRFIGRMLLLVRSSRIFLESVFA